MRLENPDKLFEAKIIKRLVVSNENHHLPVGTQLGLTGNINGVSAYECVHIGHYRPWDEGKQHVKQGQIIWVDKGYLERITGERLDV